jgi:hypothetical protein
LTRIVAVISLALALVGTATANSAVDAEAMPIDEFIRVLGERAVDLDTQEATLLVKLISEIEKSAPLVRKIPQYLPRALEISGRRYFRFKNTASELNSTIGKALSLGETNTAVPGNSGRLDTN